MRENLSKVARAIQYTIINSRTQSCDIKSSQVKPARSSSRLTPLHTACRIQLHYLLLMAERICAPSSPAFLDYSLPSRMLNIKYLHDQHNIDVLSNVIIHAMNYSPQYLFSRLKSYMQPCSGECRSFMPLHHRKRNRCRGTRLQEWP